MLGRSVFDTVLYDKDFSDLRKVDGFLLVLRFPPPNITDRHDITELLLNVAPSTLTILFTDLGIFSYL